MADSNRMTRYIFDHSLQKSYNRSVKHLLVFYHDDVERNKGSASEFIQILCKYLSAFLDVRLFTYTDSDKMAIVSSDGYKWSRITRLGFAKNPPLLRSALAAKGMRAICALDPRLSIYSLKAPRDSIVLCIDPYAGLLPLFIYKALGHKVFYRPNDALSSLGKQLLQSGEFAIGLVALAYGTLSEGIFSRVADGVFVPSQHVRASFARHGLKTDVRVVPNGIEPVDSSLPDGEAIRRRIRGELHLGEDNHVYLYVGTGNWKPNQLSIKFLIDQLAPFLTLRDPAARIMIVGQETERYREWVNAENVIIAGQVDPISQYVHASDVGLAPLLIFGGIPHKVLTYLQWGLPVLATENVRSLVAPQRGLHFTSLRDFPENLLELTERQVDWSERRIIASVTNMNYSVESISRELTGLMLQSSQKSPRIPRT